MNTTNKLNLQEKLIEDNNKKSNNISEYPRIGYQPSINPMTFNRSFNKLIIPYDFEQKRYLIKQPEIAFYEDKDYVIKTLDEFSMNPVFNIEKRFKPRGCKKFMLYIPNIFLLLFLLYIFVFIALLTYFNPAILFFTFTIMKKTYDSLRKMRFIVKEKMKMKELRKVLSNENKSKFCLEKKIEWVLGQSGYWMEVIKNDE